MIAIIRISGMVDVNVKIRATLDRLRLRKKYSCVVLKETPELMGMLRKTEQFVSYGSIDDETLKELIIRRGRLVGDKPISADKADEMIKRIEKHEFKDLKPFFRLHPPKGGFRKKCRKIYPSGILGNNKKINDLIKRML